MLLVILCSTQHHCGQYCCTSANRSENLVLVCDCNCGADMFSRTTSCYFYSQYYYYEWQKHTQFIYFYFILFSVVNLIALRRFFGKNCWNLRTLVWNRVRLDVVVSCLMPQQHCRIVNKWSTKNMFWIAFSPFHSSTIASFSSWERLFQRSWNILLVATFSSS